MSDFSDGNLSGKWGLKLGGKCTWHSIAATKVIETTGFHGARHRSETGIVEKTTVTIQGADTRTKIHATDAGKNNVTGVITRTMISPLSVGATITAFMTGTESDR